MFHVSTSGSFRNLENFLTKISRGEIFAQLEQYGQRGVNALASATPVDTGLTAQSWRYRIIRARGRYSIEWYNTHEENGTPVVIWLQYGHGTRNGGWVQGRDFINPAIQPVFDEIANDVWEKVRRG